MELLVAHQSQIENRKSQIENAAHAQSPMPLHQLLMAA